LEIAKELQWLPAEGIPPRLRAKLAEMADESKVAAIERGMPDIIGVSWIAVIVSTGTRNALHPGRSIEQPLADNKYMGAFSTLLSLIALGILLETLTS
jgi:hypothetical protein